LLPGMIAEVNIPLPANASTFVVSRNAIMDTSEGIYVIKVENGKAVKVPVKKGRESDDKVEIFGQLSAGNELVAQPSDEMKDGSVIKH
jgi:membrane fusion protein (multidrug efflux system)